MKQVRRRAFVPAVSAIGLLGAAWAVMSWYSSPTTSVLLADAWLLCTGAR